LTQQKDKGGKVVIDMSLYRCHLDQPKYNQSKSYREQGQGKILEYVKIHKAKLILWVQRKEKVD
jgi:hypothetical protein